MAILEDPHGKRVDPAAFSAAYDALMSFVPHAQLRAGVAERVAVALLAHRTSHGVDHMRALAASGDERAEIVTAIKSVATSAATTVTTRAVDAAVRAAAEAMAPAD